jgi:hypothetical protein
MKRLFASAALAMLVTAVAVPAMAMPTASTWGIGYFRPEAPIGARMWFSRRRWAVTSASASSREQVVLPARPISRPGRSIRVPIVIANA